MIDIRHIDFKQLKESGLKAVVFDKDNTLTLPYKNEVYPPLKSAFEDCISVFGKSVGIVSNSAGTPDDVGGKQALIIERDLGVPVIRRAEKKPAGAEKLGSYFGCRNDQVVVIGDRVLTDIVYGKLGGSKTILVRNILSAKGDNWFASQFLNFVTICDMLGRWTRYGKRRLHELFAAAALCKSRESYADVRDLERDGGIKIASADQTHESFQTVIFAVVVTGVTIHGSFMDRKEVVISTYGVMLGVLSSVTTAGHAIVIKLNLESVKGSTLDLVYYNNLLSAILILPVVVLSGELGVLGNLIYSEITSGTTVGLASDADGSLDGFDPAKKSLQTLLLGGIITGFFGFLINVAGFFQIKVTSPLSHMISSAFRGV
ncbi:hypothetical protein HDU97_000371 [Phlyctochytrium planicorne]|nr:hypothetical protein HDU97_000371 [Phlyctochytrium planicorne]